MSASLILPEYPAQAALAASAPSTFFTACQAPGIYPQSEVFKGPYPSNIVTTMKPPKSLANARQTLGALRETVWIALDTLRAHKLRTFLTLLGVILAVTTLVAVISVLNGLNVYVADKVANLGANAFVIDRIGIVTNQQEWY